jgi:hypothetical protein
MIPKNFFIFLIFLHLINLNFTSTFSLKSKSLIDENKPNLDFTADYHRDESFEHKKEEMVIHILKEKKKAKNKRLLKLEKDQETVISNLTGSTLQIYQLFANDDEINNSLTNIENENLMVEDKIQSIKTAKSNRFPKMTNENLDNDISNIEKENLENGISKIEKKNLENNISKITGSTVQIYKLFAGQNENGSMNSEIRNEKKFNMERKQYENDKDAHDAATTDHSITSINTFQSNPKSITGFSLQFYQLYGYHSSLTFEIDRKRQNFIYDLNKAIDSELSKLQHSLVKKHNIFREESKIAKDRIEDGKEFWIIIKNQIYEGIIEKNFFQDLMIIATKGTLKYTVRNLIIKILLKKSKNYLMNAIHDIMTECTEENNVSISILPFIYRYQCILKLFQFLENKIQKSFENVKCTLDLKFNTILDTFLNQFEFREISSLELRLLLETVSNTANAAYNLEYIFKENNNDRKSKKKKYKCINCYYF